MPHRDAVHDGAQQGGAFRKALLTEAVNAYLEGNGITWKTVLRDAINAGIGFDPLAAGLRKPGKRLHRVPGPRGNPNTANFFAIFQILRERVGVRFTVRAA